MKSKTVRRLGWALVYVGGVILANVLSERLGLLPIGLGLTTTAGTFAAAVVLVGLLAALILRGSRALLREPVNAESS